jgi:hypothetical protein
MTSKNYGQSGVAGTVELGKGGNKIGSAIGIVSILANNGSDLAVTRAADPIGETDLVTLGYLRRQASVQITGQISGGSPPAAGAAGTRYICTTTGGTFTVNRIYYSNGVAWVEVVPFEGMSMVVTDALTGGAVEFLADHVYVWDADGTPAWDDIGPVTSTSMTKVLQQRTVNFSHASGALNVGATVPENARALGYRVDITEAFDGTAPTLVIGDAGDTDRLSPIGETDLKTVGLYSGDLSYLYSVGTQITATVTPDSSSTGEGNITVYWAEA